MYFSRHRQADSTHRKPWSELVLHFAVSLGNSPFTCLLHKTESVKVTEYHLLRTWCQHRVMFLLQQLIHMMWACGIFHYDYWLVTTYQPSSLFSLFKNTQLSCFSLVTICCFSLFYVIVYRVSLDCRLLVVKKKEFKDFTLTFFNRLIKKII